MSLRFLDHRRVVSDHRIAGMVADPLDEVLQATLAGVVCGADDWEAVGEVATGALDWLRRFLPFGNVILLGAEQSSRRTASGFDSP